MEFSTKDVAKIAKVTKQTIYNWLKSAKIPEPQRDYRGYRIFSDEDLKRILDYKNKSTTSEER